MRLHPPNPQALIPEGVRPFLRQVARWQPATPLARARWVSLILTLFNTVPLLLLLARGSTAPSSVRLAAGVALAWLCWSWGRVLRRPRAALWMNMLDGVAFFAITVGVGEVEAPITILYTSLAYRGWEESRRLVTRVSVLCMAGYLAALPFVRSPLPAHAPVYFAFQMAGVSFTVMMVNLIARALSRHERAMDREQTLTQAGTALLSCLDASSIFRVAAGAIDRLAVGYGPVCSRLLSGDLPDLAVFAGEDARPQVTVTRTSLWAFPPGMRQPLLDGATVHGAGAEAAGLARSLGMPDCLHLVVVPLQVRRRLAGMIVLASGDPLTDDVRPPLSLLATQVTLALENAELSADVQAREARFRSLVQHSADLVFVLDAASAITYVAPPVERLLGYSPSQLENADALSFIHPDELDSVRRAFAEVFAHPDQPRMIEARVRRADGAWIWIDGSITNLLADPHVRGIVINSRDITERKALEARLSYQAFRDALTSLPNRPLFLDWLTRALARAVRSGDLVAVLFLDLDNFKLINDTLGHQAGDSLLVAVSERLQGTVRPEDTVARMGGDEFTVLLEGLPDARDAHALAERVARSLDRPFVIAGRELVVTTSIGIAVGHGGDVSPDELVRRADVAMYEAKRAGRARHAAFDRRLDTGAWERLDREAALRRGIESGEFVVYYQPAVSLDTGDVRELEALVRWAHPQRGLLPPAEFISLAEGTGLIVPLGQQVLEQSCRQMQRWREQGCAMAGVRINVNLSARQFEQPALVENVRRALDASGLDPRLVTLEITETTAMRDPAAAAAAMHALRAIGVQFAVDDFGTGYSALSSLKQFPIDAVKIDRSFVDGVCHDAEDSAIVRAVLAMADALGLRVTAEGVETAAQRSALQELGCGLGQGYYFAKPLPANKIEELLGLGWRPDGRRSSGEPTPVA